MLGSSHQSYEILNEFPAQFEANAYEIMFICVQYLQTEKRGSGSIFVPPLRSHFFLHEPKLNEFPVKLEASAYEIMFICVQYLQIEKKKGFGSLAKACLAFAGSRGF